MIDINFRQSPIHQWLETRSPKWRDVGGAPLAICFQDTQSEKEALRSLALCDLSALTKLGVKGRDAQGWLSAQGICVPATIYSSDALADDGTIVRLGKEEFLLESGIANEVVPAVARQLHSAAGQVFAAERQDATFLLVGPRAIEVWAQTCGCDFRKAPVGQALLTRVAGVSCAILPERIADIVAYRVWVDPSYAVYLWETFVEICERLDGTIVGAGCIYPSLQ